MSYDIRLAGITLDTPHDMRGGTYALGGTTEPWLNVTYNYSRHFLRLWPERGIRTLYGMTAAESLPVLRAAVEQLREDDPPAVSYWDGTEGNARLSLYGLIEIATQAVKEGKGEARWDGD